MNAPSSRQRGVILMIYRLYISTKWQIGHRTSEFCIDAAVLTDQSSNPFMKNFWSLLSYWLILPRGSLKHDQEKQAATALSWKWKQFWVISTSQWYWGDPGHWHGTKQGMQDYIHLPLRGNSSLECGHGSIRWVHSSQASRSVKDDHCLPLLCSQRKSRLSSTWGLP